MDLLESFWGIFKAILSINCVLVSKITVVLNVKFFLANLNCEQPWLRFYCEKVWF